MNKALAAIMLGATGLVLGPAAHAITKQAALQILGEQVLKPSANDDLICAWMTPASLPAGIIETVDGDVSVNIAALSGNPQWFVYLDLEPCALLEHDVEYIFIDDVTGIVTTVAADNWPALDGDEILADDPRVGGTLIHIYPAIPRPSIEAPFLPGSGSDDYGDAPEGSGREAYPGVPGRFPTLLSTLNAWPGRTGGIAGVKPVPEVMLGNFVSEESGPVDPGDPDGVPNMVDADDDERVFFTYDANSSPAKSSIIFDVTLAGVVPAVPHFVNVAVDLDNNGKWENIGGITEWTVVNFAVPLPATAGTYTRLTPEFDWTGSVPEGPTLAWVRMLLTRNETIPTALFGSSGWDGSGTFVEGEVEDFKFYRDCCPGEGCPPPPGGPPPDDDDEENPPPSEELRWDGTPIRRYALVVQGPDHAGDTALKQAADNMEKLFQTQGYHEVSRKTWNGSGTNRATTANILQWFCDVKAKVLCQDKVIVYFIAHGDANSPGGSIHLRRKRSGDPGIYTGAELAAALAKIPPCPPGAPNFYWCNTKERSCDVTILMESCFAGQFLSTLSGPGRRIVTSSQGTTKSYFGVNGNGCEYSNKYKECAKPSNKNAVDGAIPGDPADGDTDPDELHMWAAAAIGSPFGNTQIPQISNMTCKCDCPPFWWDCICDLEPLDGIEVGFLPAQLFGPLGGLIGQSFMSPPFPPPPHFVPFGIPLYDFVQVPDDVAQVQWGRKWTGPERASISCKSRSNS